MKLIEVFADQSQLDTIAAIAETHEVYEFRAGMVYDDQQQQMNLVVSDDKFQTVLDALQNALTAQADARIRAFPLDVVIPRPDADERRKAASASASREELYRQVERNAHLDMNFVVLVVLSTIVAAIGLIENNVAVVIGAMVIAPLLGPNLALGLGAALGDLDLMRKALVTTTVGILVALTFSVFLGLLLPVTEYSDELMARTDANWAAIALAFASGAAAALSMTSGLPSVLVGVMVAVALLPPTATLGIMLAQGQLDLASGAGLLLAVNIVSVNLASKLVFLVKGIRPRTWWEKAKAKRAMTVNILIWVLTLSLLGVAIWFRHALELT